MFGKNYNLRAYGLKHKALYALASMLLFFAIFDSILSYALPILLTEKGFSSTELGLIIGFSSVAGALFDVIFSKVLKNTNYRRMFLFMIIGCLAFFCTLTARSSFLVYLLAMAIWGLYWNFLTYGLYNFVASHESIKEHASSWGILDIFKGVGLVVAPILASVAIAGQVGTTLYIVALFFLFIVYIFYLIVIKVSNKPKKQTVVVSEVKRVSHSFATWRKIAVILMPVLVLNIILSAYDLAFVTIGPLVSESLSQTHHVGGVFLTLYYLPTLLILWFVGPITAKYGKKRTAFIGFSIGALATGLMAFFGASLILLPIVLFSSIISSVAWPALKGAFADYIARTPEYEKEIEILTNFTGNIGCILGPSIAGILADKVGNLEALSVIGVACSIVAGIAFIFTPKKIKVKMDVQLV